MLSYVDHMQERISIRTRSCIPVFLHDRLEESEFFRPTKSNQKAVSARTSLYKTTR